MALSHITDRTESAEELHTPRLSVVVEQSQAASHDSFDRMESTWVRAWHWLYVSLLKRTLDIIVASGALLLVAPLFIIVTIAIRMDSSGPAFYRQQRVGRDGREFTIYKFRTMIEDPGHGLRMLQAPDGTLRHKIRNDPRITRVGAWLRRTSIDELPQLINILLGHMSLIGPRPELVEIVQRYEPWQHRRHNVRPGLTGWWQVSGRGNRPMHENTELDLYYVDHISPGLDLKILFRTVMVVIKGLGAF
jgi:exopolysaccharide biosynthesis polyprenyl glycosylphosphotransferase